MIKQQKKIIRVTLQKTKWHYAANYTVLSKGTEDLDNNFNFNTAISAIMELVNAMYAHKDKAESVNADLANELHIISCCC